LIIFDRNFDAGEGAAVMVKQDIQLRSWQRRIILGDNQYKAK
jgi:hypothetical protein